MQPKCDDRNHYGAKDEKQEIERNRRPSPFARRARQLSQQGKRLVRNSRQKARNHARDEYPPLVRHYRNSFAAKLLPP